jgi:hypothetical protein
LAPKPEIVLPPPERAEEAGAGLGLAGVEDLEPLAALEEEELPLPCREE